MSRILVIEDDEGVALLERRRLERAGYAVTVATSAPEAMRALVKGDIDLVVLDQHLPGEIEGLDLFSRMRPGGFDIPVIVVTGSSDDDTLLKALRAGVRDYVAKSSNYLDYLPGAVARVLAQVRTECEVALARAQLAGVVGSTLDAILTVDESQRIQLFNPAAERLFRCTAAEALGQHLDRFVPNRRPESQGQGVYETLGIRADGEPVLLMASVTRIHLPGLPDFLSVVLRDITERRRAEDERERLSALVHNSSDFIAVTDLEGRMVFLSEAGRKLLGAPEAELSRDLGLSDLLTEESARQWHGVELPAARAQGRWEGDGRLKHLHTGEEIEVQVSTFMVRRPGTGEAMCIGTIRRDVRERKRIELQSKVVFMDRMASMGTLAAGVAHEMSNPLAYVLSNIELAEESLERSPKPEGLSEAGATAVLSMLGEARQGAQRVREILRGLKTFSRAEDETNTPTDVRAALEMSVSIASAEIRRRASLSLDFKPMPKVMANDARLGQVFLNLLVNAAQSLPDNRSAQNHIRLVTFTNAQGCAVVEVHDTGPGMLPNVKARIFDPFFTTKPAGEGTGLGLSICHGIVTSLGGDITVESHVGQGTVFTVVLPPADPKVLS